MAIAYNVKDRSTIEDKVIFLRIEPSSKRNALQEVFEQLSDLSWIDSIIPQCLKQSFTIRAKGTLDKLQEIIDKSLNEGTGDSIVRDAGEYIVSGISREAIKNELSYREVPFPEIFREKITGNPGFDYYAINLNDVLLFAEAKFITGHNAYGSSLEQICRFIDEKRDLADLPDLYILVPNPNSTLSKVASGEKGYIAAFSSTDIDSEKLVINIQRNEHYAHAKTYNELVLVAVDMI